MLPTALAARRMTALVVGNPDKSRQTLSKALNAADSAGGDDGSGCRGTSIWPIWTQIGGGFIWVHSVPSGISQLIPYQRGMAPHLGTLL